MQRNEKNMWEKMSRVITRPVFAAATLSLVLIINVFVAFQGISALDNEPDLSDMVTTEDLRTTAFYDIENVQP
jgi:hypothetical protein